MSQLDYDTQVEEIKKLNAPILREFQKSLEKAGLAKKTIKSHLRAVTINGTKTYAKSSVTVLTTLLALQVIYSQNLY